LEITGYRSYLREHHCKSYCRGFVPEAHAKFCADPSHFVSYSWFALLPFADPVTYEKRKMLSLPLHPFIYILDGFLTFIKFQSDKFRYKQLLFQHHVLSHNMVSHCSLLIVLALTLLSGNKATAQDCFDRLNQACTDEFASCKEPCAAGDADCTVACVNQNSNCLQDIPVICDAVDAVSTPAPILNDVDYDGCQAALTNAGTDAMLYADFERAIVSYSAGLCASGTTFSSAQYDFRDLVCGACVSESEDVFGDFDSLRECCAQNATLSAKITGDTFNRACNLMDEYVHQECDHRITDCISACGDTFEVCLAGCGDAAGCNCGQEQVDCMGQCQTTFGDSTGVVDDGSNSSGGGDSTGVVEDDGSNSSGGDVPGSSEEQPISSDGEDASEEDSSNGNMSGGDTVFGGLGLKYAEMALFSSSVIVSLLL
jgi:hypothetical protein